VRRASVKELIKFKIKIKFKINVRRASVKELNFFGLLNVMTAI